MRIPKLEQNVNSRKGMKKMEGRKFRKMQQKIAAFLMVLTIIVTSIGMIPIKADAAGRKIVKKLSPNQTGGKRRSNRSWRCSISEADTDQHRNSGSSC